MATNDDHVEDSKEENADEHFRDYFYNLISWSKFKKFQFDFTIQMNNSEAAKSKFFNDIKVYKNILEDVVSPSYLKSSFIAGDCLIKRKIGKNFKKDKARFSSSDNKVLKISIPVDNEWDLCCNHMDYLVKKYTNSSSASLLPEQNEIILQSFGRTVKIELTKSNFFKYMHDIQKESDKVGYNYAEDRIFFSSYFHRSLVFGKDMFINL